MRFIWSAQRRKTAQSLLFSLRSNPVYVPLLVAVSGKLVECVSLIGEQGILYSGARADRPYLVLKPTFGGRLEGVHGDA
jgi:hypothetical protein